MTNSINFKHLPIQDLVFSGIIIFIISTIIANIYNPLLGIIYASGNILTLTFLSWLYQDTWNETSKYILFMKKIKITNLLLWP